MNRDPDIFPDDVNGDALWEMQQSGDDLSKPREIEFTIVFSEEEEALKFGETLLINRQKILLADNNENKTHPFEIVVYVYMEATYDEITGYQDLLEMHATKFNGRGDGWGCLEQ
ncbi:MAG: ribonuclease E inhibitor RraB [Proteobacteria bacterium]|nr:ribonuclease E inhibitor RraB [Pseudomonadota bacterium]NOG60367.1 ribonuclease E inhibitor RraB [Pseudomonadota bacterium]